MDFFPGLTISMRPGARFRSPFLSPRPPPPPLPRLFFPFPLASAPRVLNDPPSGNTAAAAAAKSNPPWPIANSASWSARLTPFKRRSSSSSVSSSSSLESIMERIAAFLRAAKDSRASSARALTTASRSASACSALRFSPRPTAPFRSGAGAVYPPGSSIRTSSFFFGYFLAATTSPSPSSTAADSARSVSSLLLRCAHACPPAARLAGSRGASSTTESFAPCQWGKSWARGTGWDAS